MVVQRVYSDRRACQTTVARAAAFPPCQRLRTIRGDDGRIPAAMLPGRLPDERSGRFYKYRTNVSAVLVFLAVANKIKKKKITTTVQAAFHCEGRVYVLYNFCRRKIFMNYGSPQKNSIPRSIFTIYIYSVAYLREGGPRVLDHPLRTKKKKSNE